MADKIVQRRVQIIIDDSGAQAAYNRLIASAGKLEKEIESGTKAGRDMSEQIQKLSTNKQRIDELSGIISGKFTPSFRQAQSAVRNLSRELNNMSKDNPRYAATFERYKQASQVFDEMKTKVNGFRQATQSVFSQIGTIAAGVGIGNGITAAVNAIKGFVSNAIQSTIKLSDEIADIQKVTGLTKDEVIGLNKELLKLDTRTGASELRQIAFAAGKLGIEGKENIMEFVRAADQINVALGEDLGEGALKDIGKLVEIFKVSEEFGLEKGLLKVGSVINDIGAASAASESFLVDFAKRVAGIAPAANISLPEVIALAGTLDSLGQTAEVSSTAIGNTLSKLATDFEGFGKIAGVTGDELRKTFQEQGGLAALKQVLAGVNQSADGFDQLIAKLGDVGIEGSRAKSVFAVLSNNLAELDRQTGLANASFVKGTSVTNEFALKNNNAAAEVEKLRKRLSTFFNDPQLQNGFTNLLKNINEFLGASKNATEVWREQSDIVKNLEKNIEPLLNRYTELTNQTKLNKTEQDELNGIILQIAETIPGAITQFDQYGRALDINAVKAREFIDLQRNILKERNRDAIRENQILQRDIEKQAEATQRILNSGQTSVITNKRLGTVEVKKLSDQDILKNQQQLSLLQDRLAGIKGIIAELNGEALRLPETINTAGGKEEDLVDTLTEKTKDAGKAMADKRKEMEALLREIQKIEEELFQNTLDPYSKRLQQIGNKYEDLFTRSGADIKVRERVLRLMLEEARQLNNDFNKEYEKNLDAQMKAQVGKEDSDALITKLFVAAEIEKKVNKETADKVAADKIAAINAVIDFEATKTPRALKARFEAEKQALENERIEAEKQAVARGESTDLVNAEFKKKGIEQEKQYNQTRLELFTEYLQAAMTGFQIFSDIMSAFEGGKLNEINARYAKEKQGLDKMLQQKLISEQDYYYKSKNLDDRAARQRAELQKKEFRRNQVMQIGQALTSGALALMSTLQAHPGALDILSFGTLRAIQIKLIIAATAAQVAKIASQKAPTFAKGGFLPQGSSHQEGGIGLYDNRTGRNVGEIEGGEPIISKRVYKSNKSLVDQLLYKGYAQDNSQIPFWHTRPIQSINVSKLNKRYFAQGGFLPMPGNNSNEDPGTTVNQEFMQKIDFMMGALINKLDQPINVKAKVVYGEYEDVGDSILGIRSSGTIN